MPAYTGKLDTRFADEEDAQDIANLVNKAFEVETEGGAYAFRSGDRVSLDELSEGSWSPHSRWLLCETPVPEERLVACLHFRFDAPADTAYVTCIAVDGEMQRQGVGSLLLRRAEAIIRNSSQCRHAKIELPHWREDVGSFLATAGYTECGGGMEAEVWAPSGVTKPTRYMLFRKDLRAPPSASPSAPLAGQEVEGELAMMSTVLDTLQQLGISVDDAEVCEVDADGVELGEPSTIQDQAPPSEGDDLKGVVEEEDIPLEDIIGELFKALRTDEGRAEFERLVRSQEEDAPEIDSHA